jgi:hypothetical protein
MVVGHATPDATSFALEAVRGSLTNGIVSYPFLEQAFRTDRCTSSRIRARLPSHFETI